MAQDMISELPTELLMQVFSHLAAADLANVQRLGRPYHNFVNENKARLAAPIIRHQLARLDRDIRKLDFAGLEIVDALIRFDHDFDLYNRWARGEDVMAEIYSFGSFYYFAQFKTVGLGASFDMSVASKLALGYFRLQYTQDTGTLHPCNSNCAIAPWNAINGVAALQLFRSMAATCPFGKGRPRRKPGRKLLFFTEPVSGLPEHKTIPMLDFNRELREGLNLPPLEDVFGPWPPRYGMRNEVLHRLVQKALSCGPKALSQLDILLEAAAMEDLEIGPSS